MLNFISCQEFKSLTKSESLKFVINPNTGKVFVDAGGKAWRCQQDISMNRPIKYVFDDEFEKGCFSNVTENNANVLFVL